MEYEKSFTLKNGKTLLVRNGEETDGCAVLENFNIAHSETDFLCTYPDENSFTAEAEEEFLKNQKESESAVELVAFVDGAVVGTAGIEPIGTKYKMKHRAEFGISILKEYWGLGIGSVLLDASIECAKKAGYTQLELTVVGANERAIRLYQKFGFTEFGRNPRGFNSRVSGYQETVYMRLEI